MLAPDAVVTLIAAADIGDIKPNSYIGTAAMPQKDGSLTAMEVQVFPEAMRGAGEGHRPYDLQPQSTMTNGTVGDVSGISGRSLTLKYKEGEKHVLVPPGTPIITYEAGNRRHADARCACDPHPHRGRRTAGPQHHPRGPRQETAWCRRCRRPPCRYSVLDEDVALPARRRRSKTVHGRR